MKDFNSYFQAIPKMESERLLLTAFNREDMDAYFDILRDPEVQKYLGGFVKKTTAEISYHLSSDFWNRGLATEVVERVTEFGLNELGLKRIQGLVMVENQASIRVLEKNGYIREGLLHNYPFGREFHNVVMLAIVK